MYYNKLKYITRSYKQLGMVATLEIAQEVFFLKNSDNLL